MNRRYTSASSPKARISAAVSAVAFTVTLFVSVAFGMTGELPAGLALAGLAACTCLV
jgi:hypothetical protein